MEKKEIIDQTRNFLQQYVGDKTIAEDEEIFSSGLINSLFAMQLVLFLEKKFQLEVENEDLDPKNFKSLNAIANFIINKK